MRTASILPRMLWILREFSRASFPRQISLACGLRASTADGNLKGRRKAAGLRAGAVCVSTKLLQNDRRTWAHAHAAQQGCARQAGALLSPMTWRPVCLRVTPAAACPLGSACSAPCAPAPCRCVPVFPLFMSSASTRQLSTMHSCVKQAVQQATLQQPLVAYVPWLNSRFETTQAFYPCSTMYMSTMYMHIATWAHQGRCVRHG